jgi:hypothetical protein
MEPVISYRITPRKQQQLALVDESPPYIDDLLDSNMNIIANNPFMAVWDKIDLVLGDGVVKTTYTINTVDLKGGKLVLEIIEGAPHDRIHLTQHFPPETMDPKRLFKGTDQIFEAIGYVDMFIINADPDTRDRNIKSYQKYLATYGDIATITYLKLELSRAIGIKIDWDCIAINTDSGSNVNQIGIMWKKDSYTVSSYNRSWYVEFVPKERHRNVIISKHTTLRQAFTALQKLIVKT